MKPRLQTAIVPKVLCTKGKVVVAAMLFATTLGAYAVDGARKIAIQKFFLEPPYKPSIWRVGPVRYIEICEDVCMMVQWDDGVLQDPFAPWDALFVYRYFFYGYPEGVHDDFVSKNKSVASKWLSTLSDECNSKKNRRTKAQCGLADLVVNNKMTMSIVRYDEGYRCVTLFDPKDFSALSPSTCDRVKPKSPNAAQSK